MYYHNGEGCMENPHSEMHVALDPDDPYSNLFCLRGESMVENINKLINKLVQDIFWMSAELSDMQTMLRMTNINLNKEKLLGKVMNIEQPRTIHLYLHEDLLKRHHNLESCNKMIFSNLEKGYYKLYIGMHYGWYLEWKNV